MSNSARQDMRRRGEVFTVNVSRLQDTSSHPAVRIWYGFREGGDPLKSIVPILIHNDENDSSTEAAEQAFRGLGQSNSIESKMRPLAYAQSTQQSRIQIKLTYDVKPVSRRKVQKLQATVEASARQWANEQWEQSVTTSTEDISPKISQRKLIIGIFEESFETFVPIFKKVPTDQELRREIRDFSIPCLRVVDDESIGDAEESAPRIKTQIEPHLLMPTS